MLVLGTFHNHLSPFSTRRLFSREATFSFVGVAYHVSKCDADKGKSRFARKKSPSGKRALCVYTLLRIAFLNDTTFLSRSVIFKGQIEKQVSGLTSLLDHPDIPVHVAINRDAIHVIDAKKNVSDVCCVAMLHFNVTGRIL